MKLYKFVAVFNFDLERKWEIKQSGAQGGFCSNANYNWKTHF